MPEFLGDTPLITCFLTPPPPNKGYYYKLLVFFRNAIFLFKLVEDRLCAPPPAIALERRDGLLFEFLGEARCASILDGEAALFRLVFVILVPVMPALFPLEGIGFVTEGFFNILLPTPPPIPLPMPLLSPPPIALPSIAD